MNKKMTCGKESTIKWRHKNKGLFANNQQCKKKYLKLFNEQQLIIFSPKLIKKYEF